MSYQHEKIISNNRLKRFRYDWYNYILIIFKLFLYAGIICMSFSRKPIIFWFHLRNMKSYSFDVQRFINIFWHSNINFQICLIQICGFQLEVFNVWSWWNIHFTSQIFPVDLNGYFTFFLTNDHRSITYNYFYKSPDTRWLNTTD